MVLSMTQQEMFEHLQACGIDTTNLTDYTAAVAAQMARRLREMAKLVYVEDAIKTALNERAALLDRYPELLKWLA